MKLLRIIPRSIPQEHLNPEDIEKMKRKLKTGDLKKITLDGDRKSVEIR